MLFIFSIKTWHLFHITSFEILILSVDLMLMLIWWCDGHIFKTIPKSIDGETVCGREMEEHLDSIYWIFIRQASGWYVQTLFRFAWLKRNDLGVIASTRSVISSEFSKERDASTNIFIICADSWITAPWVVLPLAVLSY